MSGADLLVRDGQQHSVQVFSGSGGLVVFGRGGLPVQTVSDDRTVLSFSAVSWC